MIDRVKKVLTRPSWLDGRTIAILTVIVAVGAITQAGFAGIRSDMAALRTELHADMAALRTELRAEIAALRTELKGDINQLRTEIKGDIGELRTDFRRLDDRVRLVEAGVVALDVGKLP